MKTKSLISVFLFVFTMALVGCTSAQQENKNAVSERYDLMDRLEILNLASTFTQYFDSYEADKYADTYTQDGVFIVKDNTRRVVLRLENSKNEIENFFKTRMEGFVKNNQQRRHLFTNFSVKKQTESSAEIRFNALLTSTDNNKLNFATTMVYECKLIKNSNGSWKFTEVISNLDKALDVKLKK